MINVKYPNMGLREYTATLTLTLIQIANIQTGLPHRKSYHTVPLLELTCIVIPLTCHSKPEDSRLKSLKYPFSARCLNHMCYSNMKTRLPPKNKILYPLAD